MTRALLVALLLSLSACGTGGATGIRSSGPGALDVQDLSTSLFPSDSEVLSDEQIIAVLEARAALPPKVKLTLLHLQHQSATRFWGYGPYWAALLPGTRQELASKLIAGVAESPRVAEAAFLPGFLLPEKPSVGHLREAAARFQADGVLLYETDCQAYENYRFLRATQAKAFCRVEVALLDVRTGIVPFTHEVLRDFTVEEQSSDANLLETVRRAEAEALAQSLSDSALALVAWFGT